MATIPATATNVTVLPDTTSTQNGHERPNSTASHHGLMSNTASRWNTVHAARPRLMNGPSVRSATGEYRHCDHGT